MFALLPVMLFALANGVSSIETDRMLQGDFDWDITAEDGYPVIGFDDASETSEVVFKYNYTGTLSATKVLSYDLFQLDCTTPADAALASTNTIVGNELTVDVDIIQETITNSVHYNEIDNTAAEINFCMRVDYSYNGPDGLEGINFHETNVTITVDLLANFTLDSIVTDRTDADAADAQASLDYPVEAYICRDDNSEVLTPGPLTQGDILQFCVKIADTVTTENVLVEDVLTFVLSQPGGSASNSIPITNTQPDALTDKTCRENGICNIQTQLASKFFTEENPQPLRVDGVAILAFGKASSMPSSSPTSAPTSAPGARRLRVPISATVTQEELQRLLDSQNASRNLQEEEGGPESPFDLEVAVVNTLESVFGEQSDVVGVSKAMVFAIIGAGITFLGASLFCYCKQKAKKAAANDEIIVDTNAPHNGIYPVKNVPGAGNNAYMIDEEASVNPVSVYTTAMSQAPPKRHRSQRPNLAGSGRGGSRASLGTCDSTCADSLSSRSLGIHSAAYDVHRMDEDNSTYVTENSSAFRQSLPSSKRAFGGEDETIFSARNEDQSVSPWSYCPPPTMKEEQID